MNLILQSIYYVAGDPFFWPSMAFTTMTGIFIGAVVYDGELEAVKKTIFSLLCFVALLVTVNLTRALPDVQTTVASFKPISSATTTVIVSLFYLGGMLLGVKLVKRAHKGRE
jgi:hypothetical protein